MSYTFSCADCKRDMAGKHYMLWDEIWLAHARRNEIVCILCFESRAGKRTTRADFMPVPLMLTTYDQELLERFNPENHWVQLYSNGRTDALAPLIHVTMDGQSLGIMDEELFVWYWEEEFAEVVQHDIVYPGGAGMVEERSVDYPGADVVHSLHV